MSSLFSPKMPKAPEPIKPPTTDDARQAEEEMMRLRRRRGRASTFLAGAARGRPSAAMLLGSGLGASSGGVAGTAADAGGSGGSGRGLGGIREQR